MRQLCIVHNPSAGSASSEGTIREAFAGLDVELSFIEISDNLTVPDQTEVIVAAGGDGTVNAVAQWAFDHDRPMAVLPVGTLNHFAKDCGLPLELAEAARVAANAKPQPIDCATLNGRVFVNNSSLGVYPALVRGREKLSDRIGKWPAAVIAWFQVMRNLASRHLTIIVDDYTYDLRTPLVFVGNNDYHLEQTGISNRTILTAGELCIYMMRANTVRSFLRIGFRLFFGRPLKHKDFIETTGRSCTIHSSRLQASVGLDGEVGIFKTPLQYLIQPEKLAVCLPASAKH